MRMRDRCLISVVALIPLTLTAEALLGEEDADSSGDAREVEEFRVVELVPTSSPGFANSFYTVPVQPY